jgi:hypothetical protein
LVVIQKKPFIFFGSEKIKLPANIVVQGIICNFIRFLEKTKNIFPILVFSKLESKEKGVKLFSEKTAK